MPATAWPFGTIKRTYPKITVLRGFDPNEPRTRQISFPVASGVTILSGQVISLAWNGTNYNWVLGCTGTNTPHFALQDSVDADVIAAGKLTGLSCSGQYEIQMGFYSAGTYNVDVPLTFDGTTGNVVPTTWGSTLPVLGVVSRNHGDISLQGIDSSVVPASNRVIAFNTLFDAHNA